MRHERLQRRWSQKDLSEKIGSDTKSVSRWEQGKAFPDLYHRQKLAEIFGKSVEELGLIERDAKASNSEDRPIAHNNLWAHWGEAPDVEGFYGRTEELGRIEEWIIKDHCRIVVILGV